MRRKAGEGGQTMPVNNYNLEYGTQRINNDKHMASLTFKLQTPKVIHLLLN